MHGTSVDLVVVGGGVSGLAVAHEMSRLHPRRRIAVLERETRPGGTMRSDRVAGCLCEWGPNGFLTNVPHTYDLALELGLSDRLLPADPGSTRRFLWVRGELREVPMAPGRFLRSDLLSARGRLRVLLEPFQGRGPREEDESVHAFASRRIGREAADVLVDAMVAGVHAGDSTQLSLRAAFPVMAEMEANHGSLTRAMMARRRERRRSGAGGGGGPAGPGGTLTSFDNGMEVLIQTLADRLGDRLVTGVEAHALERTAGGWVVRGERNGAPVSWTAPEVVLAVPAFLAAKLLSPHGPRLGSLLEEIPYAGITVACLIYERGQVSHPLDGFGFLVPRGQGARMLGCLWSGSIFPSHVPSDRVLLRVMLGGARDPEASILNEGNTVDLAHHELVRILGGIEGRPRHVRLYRHPRGIPQYVQGHRRRLDAVDAELGRLPGVFLAGNAYHGIGVNDCVRSARELVLRLGTREGAPDEHPSMTRGGSL